MDAPEVTVAVPVKDRREQMLRCLDALLAQDHPSYEILVLDNESTDGTPDAVRAHAAGAGVPVRVEVVSGSVGRARNRAGELARGEFLAFTDSDCLPDPGWLSACAAALRADPDLGVVQGRTIPEVEPSEGWAATIHIESFTGRYESCNLAFRREAFARSDGFDDRKPHMWEDTAAGFAVRRLGYRAAFVPEALVRHDVTYPGFWWHARRMQGNRNLAAVVARYPEIRRELLFWRVFLRERDAMFVAFLAAALLARRHPLLATALALPYARELTRDTEAGRGRGELADPKPYAQAMVMDASRLIAFLRGAARHGELVL